MCNEWIRLNELLPQPIYLFTLFSVLPSTPRLSLEAFQGLSQQNALLLWNKQAFSSLLIVNACLQLSRCNLGCEIWCAFRRERSSRRWGRQLTESFEGKQIKINFVAGKCGFILKLGGNGGFFGHKIRWSGKVRTNMGPMECSFAKMCLEILCIL